MREKRLSAACHGKHAHESFVAASEIASRMRARGLGVYRCPNCHMYHIGGLKRPDAKPDISKRRACYGWHRGKHAF